MFGNYSRIAVTGGRFYQNRQKVFDILDRLDPKVVIHGACVVRGEMSGADRWADEYAIERSIACLRYPADWDRYGRSAGMKRNKKMLQLSFPDLLVVFPGGPGTANCRKEADGMGIEIFTVSC